MHPASVVDPVRVRVTVVSAACRVDLLLPAVVPVVELVPELARRTGLLDAATARRGYQLVDLDGRVLQGAACLTAQGVEDGDLLTITPRLDDGPAGSHDDSAEAMAEAVERSLRPWRPATGRRTALVAAGVLLALTAGAQLREGGGRAARALAATVAAVLVVGGLAADHARVGHGVVLTWLAAPHAAVAGLLLPPGRLPPTWPLPVAVLGVPLAWAGVGLVMVGLVGVVGLRARRLQALPVVVTGAVLLLSGLAARLLPVRPDVVHTTVLAAVVLAGHLLPWLALGVTGTRADPVVLADDSAPSPAAVDTIAIEADARAAHDVLLALSASVGVVLVLASPLAVGRGAAGSVLAVMCCLAVMLRVRQHRGAAEVLAGLVSGFGGLVSVTVTLVLVHEPWRVWFAVGLVVPGLLLAGWALVPTGSPERWGWLGDVVETVALLSLLPLLVVATGVLARVWG